MVCTFPGLMAMRLVPNWVNSARTKRSKPEPIEVSRITAAMPTAIPRPVRKECIFLALRERKVYWICSENCMAYRLAKA